MCPREKTPILNDSVTSLHIRFTQKADTGHKTHSTGAQSANWRIFDVPFAIFMNESALHYAKLNASLKGVNEQIQGPHVCVCGSAVGYIV